MNEKSAVHFGKCQLDVYQDYTLWTTNNIIKMGNHDRHLSKCTVVISHKRMFDRYINLNTCFNVIFLSHNIKTILAF